jgi:hypothetical protein
MKKRNIVIAAVLMMSMTIIPACDLVEECGTCELVTEDADGNRTYGTPLPFCGDDLKDKEDASPVTINGITTFWNCY